MEVAVPTVENLGAVDQLGRYTLIGELARGGMGIVYLAVSQGVGGFNKLCVVKELQIDTPDGTHVRMFLDEARLSAQLSHPNIVQTFEVGSELDRHFLVMEFLDGQTMSRLLRRAKRSEHTELTRLVLYILSEVLAGLHAAHTQRGFDGIPLGVVHRDVSPQNIFVTYDGTVKVVDFGIAKTRAATHRTAFGTVKGKIAYMSPEQVTNTAVTQQADIFSAGCVLFEGLTGGRLWGTRTDDEILELLRTFRVPDPLDVAPGLDPQLAQIVRLATAAHPQNRYPTALAMQAAIDEHPLSRAPAKETARLLSSVLLKLFEREHSRVRTLVEAQLARIADKSTLRDIPLMHFSERLSGTPFSHSESLSPNAAGVPNSGELAHSGASSQVSHREPTPLRPTIPSKPPRSRSLTWLYVGLFAVAIWGGALWLGLKPRDPKPTEPPKVAAAQTVAVRVQSTPSGALVFEEGRVLGETPCELPLSVGNHALSLRKDGFDSSRIELQLAAGDGKRDVQVSLVPTAVKAGVSGTALQPTPGPGVAKSGKVNTKGAKTEPSGHVPEEEDPIPLVK